MVRFVKPTIAILMKITAQNSQNKIDCLNIIFRMKKYFYWEEVTQKNTIFIQLPNFEPLYSMFVLAGPFKSLNLKLK